MQNQDNKYFRDLNEKRIKIDKIDRDILKLLSERMSVVAEVKKIKDEHNEDFFIKSAREADMIKDLIEISDQNIPDSVIANIWRKLITTSNMFEQPIKIALYNPDNNLQYQYLLQEYYADFVPIISHNSAQDVILDLENNKAQISAFALSENNQNQKDSWWINLANNNSAIKIFAKIPFFKKENEPDLFVGAKKPQEKSRSDSTLLCVELSNEFRSNILLSDLEKLGLKSKILESTKLKSVNNIEFHLVQIEKYIDENSEILSQIKALKSKPFVKILGNFANI